MNFVDHKVVRAGLSAVVGFREMGVIARQIVVPVLDHNRIFGGPKADCRNGANAGYNGKHAERSGLA